MCTARVAHHIYKDIPSTSIYIGSFTSANQKLIAGALSVLTMTLPQPSNDAATLMRLMRRSYIFRRTGTSTSMTGPETRTHLG